MPCEYRPADRSQHDWTGKSALRGQVVEKRGKRHPDENETSVSEEDPNRRGETRWARDHEDGSHGYAT